MSVGEDEMFEFWWKTNLNFKWKLEETYHPDIEQSRRVTYNNLYEVDYIIYRVLTLNNIVVESQQLTFHIQIGTAVNIT